MGDAPPPPADPARLQRDIDALRDGQAALASEVRDLRASQPMGSGADLRRARLLEIQPLRDALVIAALLALVWLGKELSLVTVPMLLAMLLAYLFEPLVQVLTRRRWFSRPGAALLIIFASLLVFVVPVTLGIGTAVVQGSQVAERVSRTSRRLVDVIDR